MTFSMGDTAEVRKKLEIMRSKYKAVFYEGLFDIGQEVRDLARDELVMSNAVDTGALWQSVYVTQNPSQVAIRSQGVSPQTSRGYVRSAVSSAIKGMSKGKKSGRKNILDAGSINRILPRPKAKRKQLNVTLGEDDDGEKIGIDEVNSPLGHGNLFKKRSASFEEVKGRPSFNPVALANYNNFYIMVGASVHYAVYIEFGTINQPARPFLRRAMHGFTIGDAEEAMLRILDKKRMLP